MSLFMVSLPVICVRFCTSTILFWLLELCSIIWNQGARCLELRFLFPRTALALLGLLTVLTRTHGSKPDFSLRIRISPRILRINKDLQSQALSGGPWSSPDHDTMTTRCVFSSTWLCCSAAGQGSREGLCRIWVQTRAFFLFNLPSFFWVP